MEHCANGDLSDLINREFGRPAWSKDDQDNIPNASDEEEPEPLPDGPDRDDPVILESKILRWLGQMADALSFVHSKNIIHRDIKSQNFFLTESGDIRLGACQFLVHMQSSNVVDLGCYAVPFHIPFGQVTLDFAARRWPTL